VWRWTIAELRALGHDAVAPALPLEDRVLARPRELAQRLVQLTSAD
jgi:hypothetical protein